MFQGHTNRRFKWHLLWNPWANFIQISNEYLYIYEMHVYSKGYGLLVKMAAIPIYVLKKKKKKVCLKVIFSPELRVRKPWNLIWSIKELRPTKFVQLMTLGLTGL